MDSNLKVSVSICRTTQTCMTTFSDCILFGSQFSSLSHLMAFLQYKKLPQEGIIRCFLIMMRFSIYYFSRKLSSNFLVKVKYLILDTGQYECCSLKLRMKISVVVYVVHSHCTYRSCLGMLKGPSSKN